MRQTLTDRRGRPLQRITLEKRVELRRLYIAEIPRWRHPFVGYVASVPLVALGILAVMLEKHLLPSFYFPGVAMLLSVLLVALFWGVGPALFSVLLAALALDYFYFPPFFQFSAFTWNAILQLLPFIIGGIIIAIITAQRESARYRALFAEQLAQEHADELALANQELEQANQLKDQFLSMASHELKTPITTIRGQAQIVLRRLSKQPEPSSEQAAVQTALQKIEEQTHRLATLVDDLLELSSMRSGKVSLRLKRCNLGEICREAVEDQRLLTGRPIDLEIPATPLTLQADPNRLSQVISNLVSNAIKYSSQESPVTVTLTRQNTAALIAVQDLGQGIPEDQQKLIFETFYRAPNAQTSSKNGWGLGLAICKDIVERHGGRIWCNSQPGKGSTFFVELPLH
jgi:signal transduction histidine kinase